MQKNHASVDRTEFFRPARGYTLQLNGDLNGMMAF